MAVAATVVLAVMVAMAGMAAVEEEQVVLAVAEAAAASVKAAEAVVRVARAVKVVVAREVGWMVADSVAAGLVVPAAADGAVEGPLVASAATNARVSKIHCSSHREVRSAVHPCNRHRGLPARRPVDRRAAWQVLRALLTRERGDLITHQASGGLTCRGVRMHLTLRRQFAASTCSAAIFLRQ